MKYKIYLEKQDGYNQYIYFSYKIVIFMEKEDILLTYPSIMISKDKISSIDFSQKFLLNNNELLKPVKFLIGNFKNETDICSRYSNKVSLIELNETIENLNLFIPNCYKRNDLNIVKNIDENIPTKIINDIEKLKNNKISILIGENYINFGYNLEFYCLHCNNIYQIKNDKLYNFNCPCCNANTNIIMKPFKEYRQKSFDKHCYSNISFSSYSTEFKKYFYFLDIKNDSSIIIYKIAYNINTKNDIISENYFVDSYIEHNINGLMKSYKILKKGLKEIDSFQVLNFNSKNFANIPYVLYDNSEDFLDFALNNETFLKKCGFTDALKYSPNRIENLESFFLFYVALVNKYPILEQIIKMGHARLFFNLYDTLLNSTSKIDMLSQINKLEQIVNKESSSGKQGLRFPTYIGDYLIAKNAPVEEYYYWRDLYELTNIDKNQFSNLINSFNYSIINSQAGLQDLGNILKFDYDLNKLLNYIIKQSKKYYLPISQIITYLTDYLNMCDICDIAIDKFPQDIKKQHDNMLIYFKQRNQDEFDSQLTKIGYDCEKYCIPDENELDNIGIPKLFKTLTVTFPKTEKDFIDEGNLQHNCVGSYANKVRDRQCVIFFIREKEKPYSPYITVECKKSGLGQCQYSNNRNVLDEDILKFAKYISKKIIMGCKSGKIDAL